eukprot:c5605_g1_i1.p1 GENE.c5605_g1_i1~~c5605_g1_i1.p1  ORF type:complete len:163 (-),score=56.64 c5605_g1_i1:39-527(-)
MTHLEPIVDKNTVIATFIVTIVLFFKFLVCSLKQAKARGKAGLRAPEDVKVGSVRQQNFGVGEGKETVEHESAVRWNALIRNDVEHLPSGLLLLWASLPFVKNANAHIAFAVGFCVFRILHSVFFASAVPSLRFLSFLLSLACVIAAVVNGLVGLDELVKSN